MAAGWLPVCGDLGKDGVRTMKLSTLVILTVVFALGELIWKLLVAEL